MAKRIEFLAPVEAMRGNLSGSQTLEYAEKNNPAYDAPVGRMNYARNYQTRYIGAKRSSSGLKYFSVKTKNAVNLSSRAKMVMALLGGTGAVRAAIKKAGIADITAIYLKAKEIGMTSAKNVDQYIYEIVYSSLEAKGPFFTFAAPGAVPASVRFRNPWVYTNQQGGVALTIKNSILVKFWSMLAINPVVFYAEGMRGVAHTGDTFQGIISSAYNVLSLRGVASASPALVAMGTIEAPMYLLSGETYATINDVPTNGQEFTLTEVAPS